MSIIISRQGQNAQKVEKSDFEAEDYLQDYIQKNPESIPVYEIEKDKKLFVVKREFATNSGPIDALAVDKDGDIYIVETKLYKNSDKRTVVAQALDYGSALWRHLDDFSEFVSTLNQETQKNFKLDFQEKLEEFFGLDREQSEIALENLKKNLIDGNLKFVILMDSIDERLKDLIVYVNRNSQFDIYAVQLEYYKFNDYEIMIPKMFGVGVDKRLKSSGGARRVWTKDDFLKDARERSDENVGKVIKDLLEFSYQTADRVNYGTGNQGCFSYKLKTQKGEITPLLVYSDGEVYSSLGFIKYQDKVSDKLVDELIDKFRKINRVKEMTHKEKEISLIKFFFDKPGEKEVGEIKSGIKEFTEKIKLK